MYRDRAARRGRTDAGGPHPPPPRAHPPQRPATRTNLQWTVLTLRRHPRASASAAEPAALERLFSRHARIAPGWRRWIGARRPTCLRTAPDAPSSWTTFSEPRERRRHRVGRALTGAGGLQVEERAAQHREHERALRAAGGGYAQRPRLGLGEQREPVRDARRGEARPRAPRIGQRARVGLGPKREERVVLARAEPAPQLGRDRRKTSAALSRRAQRTWSRSASSSRRARASSAATSSAFEPKRNSRPAGSNRSPRRAGAARGRRRRARARTRRRARAERFSTRVVDGARAADRPYAASRRPSGVGAAGSWSSGRKLRAPEWRSTASSDGPAMIRRRSPCSS